MEQTIASPLLDPLLTRTREIERLNHEMLLLYNASHQLNHAAAPAAQLEAISDIARRTGAVRGSLLYIDQSADCEPLEHATLVAEWMLPPQEAIGVGTRFDTVSLPFVQSLFRLPAQPMLIEDFMTHHAADETSRTIAADYNQRATVILPIWNNGRWIAIIWFSWQDERAFTDDDYRIYTALMQQAAPVIDAVRLLEEATQRTHDLETAHAEIDLLYRTSEAINRANTYDELIEAVAPFDPDADVVTLMLWENLDWHTATYIDVVAVIDRRTSSGTVQKGDRYPREAYPVAEQMIGQRVWIFEDIVNDPRVDAVTRQSWLAMDIHAFMGPAFYIDDKWAGGITFHTSRPRQYSQRELRLLTAIGDLVMAAVRRMVSQYEIIRTRRQLEAITHMSAAAASILNERELLVSISDLIQNQFVNYRSAIFLYDDAQQCLNWASPAAAQPSIALTDVTSPAAQVARTLESVVVNDIASATAYTIVRLSSQVQSLMALPMVTGEHLIGVLEIQSNAVHRFHAADIRVMSTLADMMAVAIQNARLYQRAQSYAVLEERNRIARELHDSVSQALYGMALGARTARTLLDRDPARAAEPLDYVLTLAEAGLAEMRALIFELRPDTLEKEGLIEALSKQVTMIRARHSLTVQTQFCPEPMIPVREKEAAYWIIREGLHNIVKHARATEITLAIQCLPQTLTIALNDNGIGFDPAADFTGHLGLQSMRERAQNIGADFVIASHSGAGTQLTLTIPAG